MIHLSIISVVYNDCCGLKRTVASIDKMLASLSDSSCVEHIVIDGCSTDGSVQYLETLKYTRSIRTVVVSEPDDGIYDAMNKGISYAGGYGLVFLNAGDTLHPECDIDLVLQDLSASLGRPNEAGLAYCAILKIGRREIKIQSREVASNRPKMPSIQQAMIYKKSVLVSIPFDSSFKICGDYDNFARIFVGLGYFRPINRVFAVFHAGGISSRRPMGLMLESCRISVRYFQLNFRNKFFVMANLVISLVIFQLLILWERVVGDGLESVDKPRDCELMS